MTSSILYNPIQVLGKKQFNKLSQNLDGVDFKPKSRADSFNRHQLGGRITYFNFMVLERKRQAMKDRASGNNSNRGNSNSSRRANDPKFPAYNETAKQFFDKKINYNTEVN